MSDFTPQSHPKEPLDSCDEEADACRSACADESECDDGDLCTSDDRTAGVYDFVPTVRDLGKSCGPATVDCGGDTVQVEILQIGNFLYPTTLFICGADLEEDQEPSMGCPDGTGCAERHWHNSKPVRTISATMDDGQPIINEISDPDTRKCGPGKVSEVTRATVFIDDTSNMVSRLENLPEGRMDILTDLLCWRGEDVVVGVERHRNDLIFAFPGNRNPPIDHSEGVACVFEGECGEWMLPRGLRGGGAGRSGGIVAMGDRIMRYARRQRPKARDGDAPTRCVPPVERGTRCG